MVRGFTLTNAKKGRKAESAFSPSCLQYSCLATFFVVRTHTHRGISILSWLDIYLGTLEFAVTSLYATTNENPGC
jgi:hypothetical protein